MPLPSIKKLYLRLPCALLLLLSACANPDRQAEIAESIALEKINTVRSEILNAQDITFISAEQALRKQLQIDQHLPLGNLASLHRSDLAIEIANKDNYTGKEQTAQPCSTLKLTLIDALQAGAGNSREYRQAKEDIFRRALDLDLQENVFRHSLTALAGSLLSTDLSGDDTVSGSETDAKANWGKKFTTGLELTAQLGLDLVKLLTSPNNSSLGIFVDTTISIPLLRGAGKDIVREPLTRAERELVYAIYRFERFKRVFAVTLVSDYLQVVKQLDVIKNEANNYKGLQEVVTISRRLSEAGRLPEIQVDQAFQDMLQARDRWLVAEQNYGRLLDRFKMTLGLPPDALIELDPEELKLLAGHFTDDSQSPREENNNDQSFPSLTDFNRDFILTALENRTDLRVAHGYLHDANRALRIAADAFLPGVNLTGTASFGEGRSLASAGEDNARLRPERGFFSAFLDLDRPFNLTEERNAYRQSLLDVDQAKRDVQELEDQIKLDVRNRLRDKIEYKEVTIIQEKSVELATRRVDSTTLLLKAGRSQMRDLLEAQEALVRAKNSLTAARVNKNIAELARARDMGTLHVGEDDLIISPEGKGIKQ